MGLLRTVLPLCFLLLAPLLRSQTPAAAPVAPTLSVDVNLVTLPVLVRDKKGQIVRNLTKDDFVLEEDGKPQVIRYFSQENNLPLSLGLLVDTSQSERDNIEKERAASRTFLTSMITPPKDRAFVIHFDHEIELLQDLTADHAKLEKAVGELESESSVESISDNKPRPRRAAGTQLYDAIFLACDEVIKKQTGRKAIIVMGDGEDHGSQETLNNAIESAQRAETIVYTIYLGGHEDHDSGFQTGPMDDDDPYDRYPNRRYPGVGIPEAIRGGSRYPRQQQNLPNGKRVLQRIARGDR